MVIEFVDDGTEELAVLERAVVEAAVTLMDAGGVQDYDWTEDGARAYRSLERTTYSLLAARAKSSPPTTINP